MRQQLNIATTAAALALAALCFESTPALAQGRGGGQPQGVREYTITAVPGVVAAGATWEIAWQGTDNADGLVAARDGSLLFAQEQPRRISRLDANDRFSVAFTDTKGVGSIAVNDRGHIYGVERTCTDPGGKPDECKEPTAVAIITPVRKMLADSFEGKGLGRVNDLVIDKKGGAYFTSGGAFYVSADGKVSAVGSDLRTNGIMLSRDEKILYVTNGDTIVAFDVRPDGTVANQRTFAKLEGGGTGDGLAIDKDGRLYVTSQPGVQVFDVNGKYLGLIATPRPVISVAFAGPGKRTLYVVGSGALGPDGQEFRTPEGVRNNAKTIYKLRTQTEGFRGRAK